MRQNKVKTNQDQEKIIKTGGKQQQQDVATFEESGSFTKRTHNHDNQDKSCLEWLENLHYINQMHLLDTIIILIHVMHKRSHSTISGYQKWPIRHHTLNAKLQARAPGFLPI